MTLSSTLYRDKLLLGVVSFSYSSTWIANSIDIILNDSMVEGANWVVDITG